MVRALDTRLKGRRFDTGPVPFSGNNLRQVVPARYAYNYAHIMSTSIYNFKHFLSDTAEPISGDISKMPRPCRLSPLPQIDIIGAMMIVWRVTWVAR